MKTTILSILLILIGTSEAYAQSYYQNDSCFNHLSEINKEWAHYKNSCDNTFISFDSDEDRIKLHLNLVCEHLLKNAPSNLTKTQLNNRVELIENLKIYANNKKFPINELHTQRQPYFVDSHGTHCAVGFLMSESGSNNLVDSIKMHYNYDYIADIKTNGVTQWADENGFTLNELAWIQPGYAANTQLQSLENGTNGVVKKMINDYTDNKLIFIGDFSQVNDLPCLNVGYYLNNNLSCLGSGVSGIINDVKRSSDNIFVFGALEHNFQIYPIAKFDGSTWTYISIPNRIGATCTVGFCSGGPNDIELSINHASITDGQEIWFYKNYNWHKKANVTGTVIDIIASSYGRVFVGHFNLANVFDANGGIVETITGINNIILYKNSPQEEWISLSGTVSDTIRTVKSIGNALYFGGSCSSSTNSVCLTKYLNNSFQTLLNFNNFSSPQTNLNINTMLFDNNTNLIIGGDFDINPSFGTYGAKLAKYNLVNDYLTAMSNLDNTVNTIINQNNDIYLGGEFMQSDLNHLAKIETSSSIEININDNVEIFPNPFSNAVTIKGIQNGVPYLIQNSNGKTVQSGIIENNSISNLEQLSNGFYTLNLSTDKGVVVKKIVK